MQTRHHDASATETHFNYDYDYPIRLNSHPNTIRHHDYPTTITVQRMPSHGLHSEEFTQRGASAAATTAIYCHTDSAATLLRTLPRSEGIYTAEIPTVHTRIRSETTQSDSPRHPVEYPPSSLFRFLFSLTSDPTKHNYI